ncbi:hypothetical protein R1flu_004344 [Riccia fluitans]|uniref:Uncharacterized protein n=1 Tax=Riccia fluitans TaxID=41844 RepID=A0ABD1YQE2_9MARC
MTYEAAAAAAASPGVGSSMSCGPSKAVTKALKTLKEKIIILDPPYPAAGTGAVQHGGAWIQEAQWNGIFHDFRTILTCIIAS